MKDRYLAKIVRLAVQRGQTVLPARHAYSVYSNCVRLLSTATGTTNNGPAPKANVSNPSPQAETKPAFFLDQATIAATNIQAVHHCGDHIRVYVDSNIFAWIVLDRKGRSGNALGGEFMECAKQAFDLVDRLVNEKKVRAAIVTSAKDTFCVGADIDQFYPMTDKEPAYQLSRAGQDFFLRMEATKYPIIAAVNGLSLGGGCELALACHHRVIASDKGKLGLPETLLGLLPGAGGTVRLPRLVGVQNALKMILTGAPQSAERCKKMGLVDAVLPSEDRFVGEYRFFRSVRSWATKLVEKPLKPAQAKPKSIVNRLLENTSVGLLLVRRESIKTLNKQTKGKYLGHYKALECVLFNARHKYAKEVCYPNEARKFSELMVTPEAKNQIALYYLDDGMKKVEKQTGLAPASIPAVRSVGVLGAGVMGSGIAHYFALRDYGIYMKDVDPKFVDRGLTFIRDEFGASVKRKRMTKDAMEKKLNRVQAGVDFDGLRTCEIIVEAAVEVMDVKKKMVQELESRGILDGKRIFATNTSSLSLNELQSASKYPQNVVGMHFFNPVAKMPLVEVIRGSKTSDNAVAMIYQLSLKIGKKPIIVNDGPGFLVNRILGAYMSEAARILRDGANPVEAERVIVDFGLPMGPLRLLDEVGLDVACHVGPVLQNGLKSDRFAVDDALKQMIQDGYLGKKNKKGFYTYDEKGREQGLDMSIVGKYMARKTSTARTIGKSEILDRCLLTMVNEASLILAEGIARSAEDVDIGMVWGTGFAPFRGGLLQYADHRGIPAIVKRLEELANTYGPHFKPSALLQKMATDGKRFHMGRPFVPYVERVGFPQVQ